MDRFIKVGRILRPRGLRGQVIVKAYSHLDTILRPRAFFIKKASGHYQEYLIDSFRQKGDRQAICSLKSVDNRDEAERISGEFIFQEVSRLPERDEDEFYWFQLEGLKVLTIEAQYLGDIHAIIETGAGDCLVVRDDEREILVPMVEGIVKQIDLDNGQCVVELPPGLIEATTTHIKRRGPNSSKKGHDI